MTPIPGAVVDSAEVKIILPEGATWVLHALNAWSIPTLQNSDVEFSPPFPAVLNWITTHTTYLDSTGRPALLFQYKDLTVMHAQSIFVCFLSYFSRVFTYLFSCRCHTDYHFLLISSNRSL
jgi:oligosaccharyltransferase complex subunit alpha (ribophorin I)